MELKKCRFCGGEALMYEIPAHKHVLVNMPGYEGGVFIECTQCSAGISAYSIEEAEAAWNRRYGDGMDKR